MAESATLRKTDWLLRLFSGGLFRKGFHLLQLLYLRALNKRQEEDDDEEGEYDDEESDEEEEPGTLGFYLRTLNIKPQEEDDDEKGEYDDKKSDKEEEYDSLRLCLGGLYRKGFHLLHLLYLRALNKKQEEDSDEEEYDSDEESDEEGEDEGGEEAKGEKEQQVKEDDKVFYEYNGYKYMYYVRPFRWRPEVKSPEEILYIQICKAKSRAATATARLKWYSYYCLPSIPEDEAVNHQEDDRSAHSSSSNFLKY